MSSLRNSLLLLVALILIIRCTEPETSGETIEAPARKPNIIIFYVDDLGYADVGCYGAKGVETPNIDKLASNGVRFTDAHSPAATCTPSRFSLLTGEYAFRNNAAILPGDAPLLIDTARLTLPKALKQAGYRTAVVGKWHLGLGYGKIDWNQRILPGPNEVGFDYSFLIPATGDRVPTVFVENGSVANLDSSDPISVDYSQPVGDDPTGTEHPELLKMKADPQHSNTIVNGVSRIGFMDGGDSARWVDEDFPFILNERSKAFIEGAGNEPFFLFYSFHDIHVPRLPHPDFQGKSSMGPRGDAIAQVDWVVGDMLQMLEEQGLAENTLIIFTSDNGPVLDDGYVDQAVELVGNHDPSGPFRGGKYSAYEAGTRVPTITYWKGNVNPKTSDALLTQVDLLASLAYLAEVEIDTSAMDSRNHLQAWLGHDETGRQVMLEEAFTMALRDGPWKYMAPHTGSVPGWLANKDVEAGLQSTPQLYNLADDPGETNDLSATNPGKVKEMETALNIIMKNEQ